jgi:C-terminal processing protease CtpA/Prc
VLPGNVGYLRIVAFAGGPGVKQAYADAMSFVRDTDSLIVDVRDNGGCDGLSVAELVGYFLEKKTLLQEEFSRVTGETRGHYSPGSVQGPRYGDRDVFVLTSSASFSAAEEFAYDLQTQKRATIVGERTSGGANHNRFVSVGGEFALSVPYGTVKNVVTGTNWEGVGVKPDVAVKADDALKVAERMAIERQLAREQDPKRKKRLENRLKALGL